MKIGHLALTFAGALLLAANAIPAAAETAGTMHNPEGGAGVTVGPGASQEKNNAQTRSDSTGAADLNAPGSGSSAAPPSATGSSENGATISHPGKSLSNPEG